MKCIRKLINNNIHPKLHNVINHYNPTKITWGKKLRVISVMIEEVYMVFSGHIAGLYNLAENLEKDFFKK